MYRSHSSVVSHISKEGEREAVRGEGEGATVKSTVSSKKLSGHQSPCQSPRGLSGEWEKERGSGIFRSMVLCTNTYMYTAALFV